MRKNQIILLVFGAILLVGLYFFGPVTPSHEGHDHASESPSGSTAVVPLDTETILKSSKEKLSPEQQAYLQKLENSIVRGDLKSQEINRLHQLAHFWRDSAIVFEPYAYYTAESAKLENSEKSLTFAANLFLESLRTEENPSLKAWMTNQAIELFERSLEVNPANDSTTIGLGSCYIFGITGKGGNELMQGVQQVLSVANRDSTNMYAQKVLGIGGLISGQYSKAITRLEKVASVEPHNLEVILYLAEANEKTGDNQAAIRWYQESKNLIVNPQVTSEIDKRIELLKK